MNFANLIKQVEDSLNFMPKDIVNIVNDFNDVFEISDKRSLQGKALIEGYKEWMKNQFRPTYRETEYQMKSNIYVRYVNNLISHVPAERKAQFRVRLEYFRDPFQWLDFLDALKESAYVLKKLS